MINRPFIHPPFVLDDAPKLHSNIHLHRVVVGTDKTRSASLWKRRALQWVVSQREVTLSLTDERPFLTVLSPLVRRWITSGEYIQMSGRAGRRGKDDRGIVIQMLDEKMDPQVAKGALPHVRRSHLCRILHMLQLLPMSSETTPGPR